MSHRECKSNSLSIRDALLEVAEDCSDPKITSETMSLANVMQNFEFIMSMVIRYDILFAMNTVDNPAEGHAAGCRVVTAKWTN